MNSLVWIQREFRVSALPSLKRAIDSASKLPGLVILAYFHDPEHTVGDASDVWLAHSLLSLQKEVANKGGKLLMLEGTFSETFQGVIEQLKIEQVFYSFQIGKPFETLQNTALEVCKKNQVALKPCYSEFLVPAGALMNQQKKPYLVFTPFYKALMAKQSLIEPIEAPILDLSVTSNLPHLPENCLHLPSSLQALMAEPWAVKIMKNWQVGEAEAWDKLDDFIDNRLPNYEIDRDMPSLIGSSGLSPYLQFGQINSRVIFFSIQTLVETGRIKASEAQPWIRQLVWREFAMHLMSHFPHTDSQPFQAKYAAMSWQENSEKLLAWQTGNTGYPMVDAGMRELWQTGTMHNRLRMLVASFLTKNLNQHWLKGKAWFDNTLLDADPANNAMGWQWVAGCGVDASPYYRLFNPVTQGEKFDADGVYIRKWLPELKLLSNKALHRPWAHEKECALKGVKLGIDYPYPIVDLKISREAHLERVTELKQVG